MDDRSNSAGAFQVGTPQAPSWEERLAAVLAPFRSVGNATNSGFRALNNALSLPGTYVADKASDLYHGALDLEDPNAGADTRNVMGALSNDVDNTMAPVRSGIEAMRGGITNAFEGLRNKEIAAGKVPVRTDQVPPMNTALGGMDAELRAGAPASPGPARQAPRPPMPTMPQRPPLQAPGVPVTPQIQRGALENPPAEAPRPSLMAQFREKTAALAPAEGKVSEQDKKQRKLEFFLNMLARNKGGSTFLQNAAAAGLDTSAGMRSDSEKAQAKAAAARTQQREDIFREIGFGDKDEDNRRGDLSEDRKLKLLEKQIQAGKVSVQKNAATGTYVVLDAATGGSKDTKIKFPKNAESGNANIELIQYLEKLPTDQRERALKTLGRGEKDDTMTVFKAAVDRVTSDLEGKQTMPTAVEEMRSGLDLARGGSRTQLPPGVPPGSKQVGTKDGKPVYEAPNGKRYKVE